MRHGRGIAKSLDGDANVSVTNLTVTSGAAGQLFQVDIIHTNRAAVTGSEISIWTNSILATNAVGLLTPTNTPDTSLTRVHVGAADVSGGSAFVGEIVEVAIFVPRLTTAERGSNYNAYFKPRYSLP